MGRSRWIALAALVAALLSIQHFGLQRQPEKQEEDQYTRLADLPPGEMVPTYIATLFFGSFRAIAVDTLWIRLKTLEEERRWYAAREVMELISILQPRNDEVWSMLGWNCAYNVSAAARNDEEAWKWIRYGIVKLREGCRHNPKSAYLPSQLAMTLWHFPSRFEHINMSICKRIESDDDLQKMLQDVDVLKARRSPFELAIRWYEKARAEIEEREKDPTFRYYTTQMGLNLFRDTMDGFIRVAMYLQGIYLWGQALTADSPNFEIAKSWFRRAEEHSREMLRKYPYMEILLKNIQLYGRMPEVLDLHREVQRRDTRENRVALLRAVEGILRDVGPFDERYLYYEATGLKRDLSREKIKFGQQPERDFIDENEYNDIIEYPSLIKAGKYLQGNLKPGPGDIDCYAFFIPHEHRDDASGGHYLEIHKAATIHVVRRGKQPLRVRVLDRDKPMAEKEVREGDLTFTVEIHKAGEFVIEVSGLDEKEPFPADTRYGIEIIKIE